MAIIKQISVYDGNSWTLDDIGVNAENVSLSANSSVTLSSILPASKLTANKALISDGSGIITTSNISTTTLNTALNGASTTTSLQSQINTINSKIGTYEMPYNSNTVTYNIAQLNTKINGKVGLSGNATTATVSASTQHNQYVRLGVTNSGGTTYMLFTDLNGIHLWDNAANSALWNIYSYKTDWASKNSVYYRKWNGITFVHGWGLSPGTSWATVTTLPSDFRPPQNITFAGACGSNGNRHMAVSINSSTGVIQISSSTASTGDGHFWICW